MKKIAIMIACVMASIGIANAQKNTIGIKAGANKSSYVLRNLSGKTDMKPGFEAGVIWRHDFSEHFALQPEAALSMQNSAYVQGMQGYKTWNMEIPVYALGQISAGKGHRFYIGLGPNLNFALAGKEAVSGSDLYKGDSLMNRFDIGAAALVGYELPFNMQINFSYKYGFLNALKTPADGASMTRNSVSLGLAYMF